MNKGLESKLDKIDAFLEETASAKLSVYKDLIEIHTNPRLRLAAKRAEGFKGFEIAYRGQKALFYSEKGFELYVRIPPDHPNPEDLYYNHAYSVDEGKLTNYMGGRKQDLLETFPAVTPGGVEAAISKGIEEMDLYRKAIGRNKK